jgi:phage gp16-like protein
MRNQLIAKVHIAKKALALDDDTYRQTLTSITGKSSCSAMNDSELEKVLGHFKGKGWKPAKATSRKYSPRTRKNGGHDQVDKIRAVWIHMYKTGVTQSGTEAALDAWVKRTTTKLNKGLGIERTDWLRSRENSHLVVSVLESLKRWQARVRREWKNEDLHRISQEQKRTDQSQAAVVKQLLEAKGIFWWPLFRELGIEDSPGYCKNRKELNHD